MLFARTTFFVALITVLVLVFAPSLAAAQDQQDRCTVGSFISDLYNLSLSGRSFDADLWFWSVCPKADRQPLRSMEYINANGVETSLDSTTPRGDLFWSNRKVVGNWRHDWDVSSYPFDRQTLRMIVEEGTDDVRLFGYEPDAEHSTYDPGIAVPGWRIAGFRILPVEHLYPTSFGDPSLAAGTGALFSRLSIEVDLVRDGLLSFLKLTAVVYVSAALALMSFRLDATSIFGDRIGLLVGALFATVISMNAANGELGSTDQLTLIDLIHVLCLVLIVTAMLLALRANRRTAKGAEAAPLREQDLRNMMVCGALFVLANVALVGNALLAK